MVIQNRSLTVPHMALPPQLAQPPQTCPPQQARPQPQQARLQPQRPRLFKRGLGQRPEPSHQVPQFQHRRPLQVNQSQLLLIRGLLGS